MLFVTKKIAIGSVESDFQRENFSFHLDVTNYERLQHFTSQPEYDVVILDEAHSLAAFPKPSLRTKLAKDVIRAAKTIYLSGTPTPESYSQIFHQLWVSSYSPFDDKNFYRWAKTYVDARKKFVGGVQVNDYTKAKTDLIEPFIKHLFISYTQSDAGFKGGAVEESALLVDMDPRIKKLQEVLLTNRYHKFLDSSEVVCDTPVKLKSKLHQISSGTVITEEGELKILDRSKVRFIKQRFKGQKIAIIYKFQAEGMMLREELENITDSPADFNISKDKIFISQIQSGSMGINLATADALVFMNIDFSFVQYWQARARAQALERLEPSKVFWVFAEGGIEEKILECVIKKRDYTDYYFRKDYGIKNSKSNTQMAQSPAGHFRGEDGARQSLRTA